MNHLTRQISDFGIQCVRKAWLKKGLGFLDEPDEGFYLLESPLTPGKSYFTKIMTKASDKNKTGNFIFGNNQDWADKIIAFQKSTPHKIAIIHVDVRTNSIGYAMFDHLMTNYEFDGWQFPYYESNKMLGKLIYWSSFSLKQVASLDENQVDELVKLRTKNKADKMQKSIFDI